MEYNDEFFLMKTTNNIHILHTLRKLFRIPAYKLYQYDNYENLFQACQIEWLNVFNIEVVMFLIKSLLDYY